MVSEGDRIRLDAKPDKYTALSAGDTGEVQGTKPSPAALTGGVTETKIFVEWDTGSTLALFAEQDAFTVMAADD